MIRSLSPAATPQSLQKDSKVHVSLCFAYCTHTTNICEINSLDIEPESGMSKITSSTNHLHPKGNWKNPWNPWGTLQYMYLTIESLCFHQILTFLKIMERSLNFVVGFVVTLFYELRKKITFWLPDNVGYVFLFCFFFSDDSTSTVKKKQLKITVPILKVCVCIIIFQYIFLVANGLEGC